MKWNILATRRPPEVEFQFWWTLKRNNFCPSSSLAPLLGACLLRYLQHLHVHLKDLVLVIVTFTDFPRQITNVDVVVLCRGQRWWELRRALQGTPVRDYGVASCARRRQGWMVAIFSWDDDAKLATGHKERSSLSLASEVWWRSLSSTLSQSWRGKQTGGQIGESNRNRLLRFSLMPIWCRSSNFWPNIKDQSIQLRRDPLLLGRNWFLRDREAFNLVTWLRFWMFSVNDYECCL